VFGYHSTTDILLTSSPWRLCEEREEQGAMEEDDVVDSGLRSAAMRMVTTTTSPWHWHSMAVRTVHMTNYKLAWLFTGSVSLWITQPYLIHLK